MCGILGINRLEDATTFERILGTIAHRGPDDHGILLTPDVSLGHQRLSILDLSRNGRQPMSILDDQVSIVFNGEIYNHLEIRKTLGEGIQFRSSSDTETILHAYLKYGKDVVKKLNGIFSFAIYDARSHELLLARDPLGVKPLYYYAKNGLFAFASELKAIVEFEGIDREIDHRALVSYIHFLWSPGPSIPFRHIKRLEPGHIMTVSLRGDAPRPPVIEKYYELPFTGEYFDATESDLIDELDAHLINAVKRQMLSDVPIGFFLSGGLDSSLIAAIARTQTTKDFHCYSIRIPESSAMDGFADDLPFARKIAKSLELPLVEVEADHEIVRDFDSMIWHLDEPQADPAPLHVLNICRDARKNRDVVLLGGTAGDDLFSGYRRHQAIGLDGLLGKIPRWLGRTMDAVARHLPTQGTQSRRLRKLTAGLGLKPEDRLLSHFAWIDLTRNRALFADGIQDEIASFHPADRLSASWATIPRESSALNRMLYLDLKYFLTDHNLNYTDKMSMAEGVEVRVPFLDLDLVEFACKLPVDLKLRGRTTKYLLRKVAQRYLPDDVIHRPKTGFGAPIREWIRQGKLDAMLGERLSPERIAQQALFDHAAVGRLIDQTKNGSFDGAYTVWSLLAIESWHRQFAT